MCAEPDTRIDKGTRPLATDVGMAMKTGEDEHHREVARLGTETEEQVLAMEKLVMAMRDKVVPLMGHQGSGLRRGL